MRAVIKVAVVAGLLVGFYLLFRTKILWLDSFEGTITERLEEKTPTVIDDKLTQNLSRFYLQIRTDDGRDVRVEVDQLEYFRSRRGMRVSKAPFGVSVEVPR
jgi:hypothetical protein